MDTQARDQVCLLIDFENMVRGLISLVGEDRLADSLDIGVLFGLAEEYGRVVVARAYADWRIKEMNQFQFDLYNQGVDLVHVLGKRLKNAVDVKLAVDAVEAIWEMPQIRTFVLVSGDRDFIHVLKALRRHGKTVVGVAPDHSVSPDFASLCDRFVSYGALRGIQAEPSGVGAEGHKAPPLAEVGEALARLLRCSPEGVKGSQIIPALRRDIAPTFDVSNYGFAKLGAMLAELHDFVDVRHSHGGDILVLPRRNAAAKPAINKDEISALIQASGLNDYRYVVSMEPRRRVLAELHRGMSNKGTFTWGEILEQVLEETSDSRITTSLLGKYFSMLWQSRAFSVADQQGLPLKERILSLADGRRTYTHFVAGYERSAVYKVKSIQPDLTPEQVVGLLGLEGEGAAALRYSRLLLAEVWETAVAGLVVPGIGAAPDSVFVKRLKTLFLNPGDLHSRGAALNHMRKLYANTGTPMDYEAINDLFLACVRHGVIEERADGAVRVYGLVSDP